MIYLQVFDALSICASYSTLLRLLDGIGSEFDYRVIEWVQSLQSSIPDISSFVSVYVLYVCTVEYRE